MTKTTNEQDKLARLVAAHNAGTAWAKSLKVGDVFLGAMPAAQAAGYTAGESEARMFMSAALDVLKGMRVCTNMDGVLIEYRQEAK